jgi:hypothetical protein
MKNPKKIVLTAALAAGGLMLLPGCVTGPDGHVSFVMPNVVVATPLPPPPPPPVVVVDEPVLVPDYYAWDGFEFVGVIGGEYVYLGPSQVWMVCEPFRLERFHGWEHGHGDWRDHAIHNDRYRRDVHGHEAPAHGGPGHAEPGHGGPGHAEPGHAEPGHGDAAHAAPGHVAPAHPDAAQAKQPNAQKGKPAAKPAEQDDKKKKKDNDQK